MSALMHLNGLASHVEVGDKVTYCGATFVVAGVAKDEVTGLLRFAVTGSYAQCVAPEREVKIERIDPAVEKPYYALTRDYDEHGNCDKRTFRFKTEKQLSSFLWRTNRCVTFHN